MKLPKLLNGSVATRTNMMVLGIVAVIMLSTGIWQTQYVRSIVADEAHRMASRSMETATKEIDNRISIIEIAVKTAASYANMFAPHEILANTLMKRLIASNEDIDAVTLMYRADYFPHHGRYYAPTITRNPRTGALEEDEIGGPENDFCYLETDSNWVYTNKLDRGYWCLPYMDSISTKRPMVTYSVPLHDDSGAVYAVLCADVGLEWVQHIVEEAKPYPYSEVIVVSRDSQYICHPEEEWIQSVNVIQHAQKQNDSHYLELAERMLQGEKGVDTLDKVFHHQPGATGEVEDTRSIVYFAPINRVQWSVSFTIPENKIMQRPNQLRAVMIALLVVLLVAIALTLYFVIHAQLRPIKQLSESTRDIAKGNFDVHLPEISTQDEIRHLRDSFEEMQHSLGHYVAELQDTTASKAAIENELRVASNIQMSMLPKKYPPFPDRDDLDIYGQLKPAKEVGGDLYDFYIRDEKLFFCIGDVSGKGVPASLFMAVTRTLFRTISAREAQPDRIITLLNDSISENNDSLMFVTLFVGVLDLPTGRLRYCNAGHDAPVLIDANGTLHSFLPVESNLPVGIMANFKFKPQDTLIDPGITVFLYTDGLTEAENTGHELFGEERIVAALHDNTTPMNIIATMTDHVHQFVDDAEQSDDLTMLAVKYTKSQLAVRLQRSIVLSNDVDDVPQLAAFVDEVCESIGFDMSTTMSINLALEEAVVNVMNYAYPQGTKGDVNVEAEANDKRLKFVITDSGTPFDPTAKAEVDTTLSAEERPIGGLGIHLVRQIMDSINYERIDGKNILTLRKKL